MAQTPCQACGIDLSPGAQTCPSCGARMATRPRGSSPFSSQPIRSKAEPTISRASIGASRPASRATTPLPWSVLLGVPAILIAVLAVLSGTLRGDVVLLLLIGLVFALMVLRQARRPEMYCPHCGTIGMSRVTAKGSWVMQAVLFFFFIVPGLIYWAWRFGPRNEICTACRQPGVMPADSPRAREMHSRQQ